MSLFKATYINNVPIHINLLVNGLTINDKYEFEHCNNFLLHAFINAIDKSEAAQLAREIAATFKADHNIH